jgi:hypothetical protein
MRALWIDSLQVALRMKGVRILRQSLFCRTRLGVADLSPV